MGLYVSEFGQGNRHVVLLHGTPMPPGALEKLALALDGHHVCLPHLPGYGQSEALPGGDLGAATARLEEALLERGVDRAVLVGFSGGAWRALDLLRRGRIGIDGVVSVGGFMALSDAQRASYRELAGAVRAGLDLGPLLQQVNLAEEARADPLLAAEVATWSKATTAAALADELEAFARADDLTGVVERAQIPLLAIAGEHDVAVPPEAAVALARAAPRGSHRALPGRGHALVLEDPGTVVATIRAFLDRL